MKDKRIMFHLDKALHDLIVAEKKKTGATLSEIIRRAIIKYFKGGD